MRSRKWLALVLLFPVVFSACTKRQVEGATADSYQYVAQGLCLTFVMDKIKKTMEPGGLFQDSVILSKQADARFRTRYHETSKAISDAKTLREKDRLDKAQLASLLEVLRQESPDLIRKCDKLADGFRRCDKFQGDRPQLKTCLERENKEPMESIVTFLNRDAVTGFPSVR